jgi:asparagine synthase (glutamine-hydrolysing)
LCGLAGFLCRETFDPIDARHRLVEVGELIAHRGPDDSGVWLDADAGIGLVHRRLSILDLSSAGHQPMLSPSGRFVIAFNGEIYNHLELRAELEKAKQATAWRGHSDTETLLAGIDAWGLADTLTRAVGMFAIALWDKRTRTLTLARDRIGEKPLYYGWQGDTFLFGSELKALRAHPTFRGEIDRDALSLFLRHNYIPTPHTIYQGLHKLPPGTLLTLPSAAHSVVLTPVAYWSLRDAIERGQAQPFQGTDQDAIAALDDLLRDAVRRQQLADVPLGAFLSGGVDSSTIVALMQAQASRPVKTFTIGFHEHNYNEAPYAQAVARHLGTDHTELYVTPQQAMAVIPRLPSIYDEPFADSSQIPIFLVSQLTRQQVTVSLSGDAGDELFGGYNRYFRTQTWWKWIHALPASLRRLGAAALMFIGPTTWDRLAPGLGNRIQKLAGVLGVKDSADLYRHFITHWPSPEDVVINGREPPTPITQPHITLENIVAQMMTLDTLSYLPDDILVKVDRAAMAVSLETRVPMLDHRVVEFAWQLPLSMKIRDGQGKWILRQVLDRYVPRTLIERPKMGFGVPLDCWLRGPLRDWAEDLLDENRLRQEGFFNPEPIRVKWAEHLAGTRNWQYHLWDVLMFQAWRENNDDLVQT